MKPDRSNYEIWFTDWLDGNLNEEQVEELKVFLEENSDLQEELNGLTVINLEPSDLIFNRKKDLLKSSESLSESQFEYLCVANLEKDLSPPQRAELNEIIDSDEEKRKRFEFIQKLKLRPLDGSFKRKGIVKKLTTGEKILRLSVIGLSAAATIALLISIFFLLPGNSENVIPQIVQNVTPDTIVIETRPAVVFDIEESATDIRRAQAFARKSIPVIPAAELNVPLAEVIDQEMTDSASLFQRAEALGFVEVGIPLNNIMPYVAEYNKIRPYDPGYVPPLIEYRSNVQLFLARLFHEKIMKDTNAGTRPVESFEIAQAGITGLNKLFGWEIALNKNTDVNGDTRSYNFSSRLLKFNAPVKKPAKAL